MKTEKRFYLIPHDMETGIDLINCSNEEFITLAEEQGKVYLSDGFVSDFNNEEINSTTDQLRIIDMPVYDDSEPHIQLINVVEVASNLAHNAMLDEMGVSIDEWEDDDRVTQQNGDDGDSFIYTDEAQDIFDRWYDYFTNHLTNDN